MKKNLTIDGIKHALTSKRLSARELTTDFFIKINARNPQINAYLELSPERAYAQADRIDSLVAAGKPLPPLGGVPVAVKDVLSTRGITTTCGSKILRNYVPPYDATAVARLEEAGAIILGKTNCDEFAMGSSNENSAYGAVKNPVAMDRVPGGSSGGSAAAVAAGLAVASLGTDTGGSIRQPGALCGIPAMMGSYGRVSRYGLIAFASSLDRIGPFANSVHDVAAVLGAIAGRDPNDSTSTTAPVPAYTEEINKPINGLRIGIPRDYFAEGMDSGVRDKVEKGIELLKRLGCKPVDIRMPHTDYAIATYYIIATAEASSNLARYDGVRHGPRVDDSTLIGMYRKTRGAGFGAEVKRRIMIGTYALSAGYYDAYYNQAQKVRTLIARDLDEAYKNVDVLISPATPTTAFPLGEKVDDPLAMYLFDLCTLPLNLAGHCGMSVPSGLSPDDNLPVGLQIMAPALADDRLYRVGAAYEAARGALPAAL